MSRNLTTTEVAGTLRVTEERVRQLVRAGLCEPARRGGRHAFSFQDVVVLRTALGLLEAHVPVRRLRRSLEALSEEVGGRPLSGLRIFADGHWLIYFDRELDELTYLPLEDTPAGLLVRDRIVLSGDITVSRIERGGGTLRVTLHKAGKADLGTITLVFTDAPIALKQWVVTDAQGIATRVTLVKPEFNVTLDAKLFEFKDPQLTPSDQR